MNMKGGSRGSWMDKQLVVFLLDSEMYGVELNRVKEIIKYQAITRLPNSPEFVEGITNLRETILPVVDLRSRFCIPRKSPDEITRIIVVASGAVRVGLIVDQVVEVISIPESSLQIMPEMPSSGQNGFINRMTRLPEGLLIQLDPQKALSLQEQYQLATLTLLA